MHSSGVNTAQPSVDAVEEVAVQASNFSAEYGQVVGPLFNFTTRSGTNLLRGSLFEYFVNDAMDAGQPFTNNGKGGHFRQHDHRQDFGFNLGGPVVLPKLYNGRNKTFFFFNYEMYVDHKNQLNIATVPTAAYRNGDFSGALTGRSLGTNPTGSAILENTIYDPLTDYNYNGFVLRTPFPGNILPASRIDPVAAKIQALIPQPNVSGTLLNNWVLAVPNPKTTWVPSFKIDHNFSDRFKLSLYYQHLNTNQLSQPDGLPTPITETRQQYMYSQMSRLNASYTLRPNLLLAFGAGIQRVIHPDGVPADDWNYPVVTQLGLTGSVNGLGFPQIGGLSMGNFGGMSLSMGAAYGFQYPTTKPTATASLTWTKGNHTYKFGSSWRIDAFTDRNMGNSTGSYSFSAAQTGLPSTQQQPLSGGSVGLAYASFLLGSVSSASVSPPVDPQFRNTSWSFYAQDTWKVTRKLTFDYGLRWDYAGAPNEIWDRWSMFGPTIVNPSAGGLQGGTAYEGYGPGRCNCQFTKTYPYAFGPRLAVAYQLLPKTVLRAGWGLIYSAPVMADYFAGSVNGLGYNTISFSTPSYDEPALYLKNGLQYNPSSLYAVSLNPGDRPTAGQLNSPGNLVDPNGGRPGRVNQWNISLQREITGNLMIEAAYVGNRGIWLQARRATGTPTDPPQVDFNALSQARLASFGLNINNAADQSLLLSTISSSLAASRGFNKLPYPGYPTTATVAQSLRPYPQFGSLPSMWSPLGNNWYDSLQVKATKRTSHGLTLTHAFTFEKEIGLGVETGATLNGVFNRPLNKSIQQYSLPFMDVTGLSYRTPQYGNNRLVKNVLGGWTLSGTLRYQSGFPLASPVAQNNLSSLVFQSTFMNRVPGVPLYLQNINGRIDPNANLALNPAAWSNPGPGQWGTASPFYNDFRSRRHPQEEIAFGRRFRIRESVNFQIRAEVFNLFNRNFLNDPSSSNPLATVTHNSQGLLTGGFGYISTTSTALPPRNLQIVARFEF